MIKALATALPAVSSAGEEAVKPARTIPIAEADHALILHIPSHLALASPVAVMDKFVKAVCVLHAALLPNSAVPVRPAVGICNAWGECVPTFLPGGR
ncbi:MAG: hypothetical protein G01um10145_592 [Microgenomates group bacterium Gr01-1014_5]|nr:MAG: hypothetical protein G01um10145_592 [Microgenomates group bacterium Gr01-1014_5]